MVVSHGSDHGHGGHGNHDGHGNYKAMAKTEEEKRNLAGLQGKESFLTSTISLYVDEYQPLIPDGGWGWFVVLAALFINLVSDGITCCFGLLYIDFLHEFGASKSATAWIGSLYVAVPLVGGPIGSALVDKYGCKKMTIVGALISTTGFIFSTYAKSIVVMYITFGFLGGIGLALCYVTAVVAIAFWFDKKRTLALGLAASGCGFGTVIYSPLITVLSREYSWRGTVLILAGLFGNMIVCGLLQRDPAWIIQEEKHRLKAQEKEKNIRENKQFKSRKISDAKYMLDRVRTSVDIKQKDRFHSVLNLPTYIEDHKEVPLEVLKNLSNDRHLYQIILKNYPNLLTSNNRSDIGLDKMAAEASMVNTRVPVKYSMEVTKSDNNDHSNNKHTHIPLTKSDSAKSKSQSNGYLQHGYLANIKLPKKESSAGLMLPQYKVTASTPDILFKNELQIEYQTSVEEEKDEKWYHNFMDTFGSVFDFSLFLDLHFFLVSIATIIMCVWFAVPFVYLADHMKALDYDDNSRSFMISAIGVTNIMGMIIIGFLGTKIKVATLYAVCLFLSGASCAAMMILSHNFYLLLISSGLFGLFYASQHSLTPAIIAQLVPLDKFSMAYGLSLLCQGIGKLIGPPLAGYLFDLTQSYSQSFYQAAVWIFVAGVFIGIIPYTKTRSLGRR